MKQSSEIDNGEKQQQQQKQQQQLFLPEILDVHNFFFLYAFRIVTCCFNMRLLPSAMFSKKKLQKWNTPCSKH